MRQAKAKNDECDAVGRIPFGSGKKGQFANAGEEECDMSCQH
jgi:hypothetical protein